MDIRLDGIGHSYDEFEVMRDITLDIPSGQIVCIVGPSGCGKSTLLRFIGGLEKPKRGRVLQLGDPPTGCLNPLTYIFQDFALLPWRSVSGNISLVLEDHGIKGLAAKTIIDDVLARTKLTDFAKALPKQLSGGMKQRVAIARALAVNPAVMLMDEPLSALDSQTRELLMDDLVELWTRQPFTAVYVTHNLAEAVRLGHKVVVLSRRPGQIRGCATKRGRPMRSCFMDNTGKSVAFRGGGFAPQSRRWVGVLVFVALILFVEWGTRAGWISALSLPRPSDVLDTFRQLYESGLLFKHLLPSLSRLFVGALIGASIGIAVGIMIGLFSYVRSGLVPLVAAIFPIPKIALLPLFVIWFGIGEGSKYALIAFGTFTPTVVATYGAVDNVDRTLIRMGQSFGLSWWSIVRKIVLPGAMPGILSGLRISLAIAIILLVAAEMLGAEYGIGAYILEAGSLYDLERLFAGVVILSLLGVLISALIGTFERRLLGWRT